MSVAVEAEGGRARPLSGGLWTLFSWLRREEHASSDSLSSAGSAATAASFAFLSPARYGAAAPAPRLSPPPPTDSYRKRVRDRDLRRLHERDVPLHRKYGLYGYAYDALSLPSAGRAAEPRGRRAASESPRAHVPGKRRAPPPPAASLPRRRARKRPAPPPPPAADHNEENVTPAPPRASDAMHRPPSPPGPARSRDAADCKPQKYSKKDSPVKDAKDVKLRHEKSFLKQIFDNRKRNSAIETSSIKLLPSISELDKQAAEMIEKYRLKEVRRSDCPASGLGDPPGSSRQDAEAWICTRCLKKYDSSVITCNYCLPLNKTNDSSKNSKYLNSCSHADRKSVTSPSGANAEDKERLKEILKEMKDSLPKRSKNFIDADVSQLKSEQKTKIDPKEEQPKVFEAPTLRIGSTICIDKSPVIQTSAASGFEKKASSSKLVSPLKHVANEKELMTINSVIITQPVVLLHTRESNVVINKSERNYRDKDNHDKMKYDSPKDVKDVTDKNIPLLERINHTNDPKPLNVISKSKYDLNTPLKISSLLNPIYVPKTTSTSNTQTPNLVKQIDVKTQKATTKQDTASVVQNVVDPAPSTSQNNPVLDAQNKKTSEEKIREIITNTTGHKITTKTNQNIKNTSSEVKSDCKEVSPLPPVVDEPSTSKGSVDQHTRRRDLINQLEKSIAKGDEHAAAEAAIKLAQLRLSCSVLSFSSQIVAENIASSSQQQTNVSKPNVDKSGNIDAVLQKISPVVEPVKAVPINKCQLIPEKVLVGDNDKHNEITPTSTKIENVQILTSSYNPVVPKLEPVNNIKFNAETKSTVAPINLPREISTSKAVQKEDEDIPILVWVEDKEATRGPVQLHVRRNAIMGELRRQAETSLGLATRMQRWIVGKTLCSDDNVPLVALAGPELTAPFYLCLVESEVKDTTKPQLEQTNEEGNVYNELVKLEKQALVSNAEVFECGVCMEECVAGSGVVLRECVHSFCKECLSDVVRHSEEPIVSCPAMGCRGVLLEREIRALVSPEDYEKWLARGLAAAESGTRNAFHCRTRDCTGWALCDPGVRRFPCPVCKHTNCVTCQVIHEGKSCEQHRSKLQEAAASADASQTDEGTRALLNSLISRGEALECPECCAIITKKWGCDWVKCSACKTEICWVTKGRRWGPAGRGDTTAGCRCGVDGKRCHPSCGYCH